jgi:hypothetical protein
MATLLAALGKKIEGPFNKISTKTDRFQGENSK